MKFQKKIILSIAMLAFFVSPIWANTKTQATIFANMTEEEAVIKIVELCREDMKCSGILASASAAQFIRESNYGKSELAQNANNMFGMKCIISNNTWEGSTWDGTTHYLKPSREVYPRGEIIVFSDFRKYSCIEESIADHSAYLSGAMSDKEGKKRYEGLVGEKDYKKAIQIIKDGGYATSSTYVEDLCEIIKKYNLTQYDEVNE